MKFLKMIISSIFYYTLLITIGTYITITILAYLKFDEFRLYSLNQAQELLHYDFIRYNFISLMALMLFLYIAVLYIKREYRYYKEKNGLQPIIVTLEELSQIWLGEKKSNYVVKEKTKFVEIGEFENVRTKNLIKSYIAPSEYIKFFPEDKLNIIIQLLRILEEGGNVSSVASKFKSDPEKIGSFTNAIDTSGKTSYQVFSKVTLYEHTMNVVDESISFMKEKEGDFFMMNLCDAIIVALAHDIGKMEKIKNIEEGAVNQIISQNPHQTVSVLFFTQLFGTEYENIREAIGNHHSAATSGSRLTRMIIASDKLARKHELEEYLNSQRNKSDQPLTDSKKSDCAKEQKIVINDSKDELKNVRTLENKKDTNMELSPLKRRRRVPIASKKETPKLFTNNNREDFKLVENISTDNNDGEINIIPIDFTQDLESKIIDELSNNINKYGIDEKITSIKSVSYQDSVLFSITYFNSVVEKYVYINKSLSKEEYKDTLHGISRYVIGVLIDKKYVNYIKKGFFFSTFPCVLNGKKGKLLVVPIKSEIFNLDTIALESMKDDFLKKISISTYNEQ